jgi:hypothetical protein
MVSAWNGAPIASPWRQGVCGSFAAVVMFAILTVPALFTAPDTPPTAPTETDASPRSTVQMQSVPSRITAFSVARPATAVRSVGSKDNKALPARALVLPAAAPEAAVAPMSFRMADGDAFPLVISIPAGPAWRDVFRAYGGAIGVSNSSSARPAYLTHTISPDGRVDEESVPTIGRFLFRLSDEAIRVVNDTLDPAAHIPPGQSAFGVFTAPFRAVVARVLQEFCATEHVSPDDLALVQLELGPGFGLRVASTTRRAKRF